MNNLNVLAWIALGTTLILAIGLVAVGISNYMLKKRLNTAKLRLTGEIKKTMMQRERLAKQKGRTDAKAAKTLDNKVDLLVDIHKRLL